MNIGKIPKAGIKVSIDNYYVCSYVASKYIYIYIYI